MSNSYKSILFGLIIGLAMTIGGCSSPGGENPGTEFMPDMSHGTAYEANYYDYYWFNTWGGEDEYYKMAQPKLPVNGTIARGSIGKASSAGGINIPASGSVPYYYGNTEPERERATAEIIKNPFPITEAGLATGKNLYTINCGICHGEKGDGNGYLVREDGGVYPAAPTSFITGDLATASNGRYYHAIMHGKNVMGSYSDKLSYEERWHVIHYIKSLQAKEAGLVYNATENTLTTIEIPAASLVTEVKEVIEEVIEETHDEDHDDSDHGDGHH